MLICWPVKDCCKCLFCLKTAEDKRSVSLKQALCCLAPTFVRFCFYWSFLDCGWPVPLDDKEVLGSAERRAMMSCIALLI